MMHFHEKLQQLRKKKGMTQEELAEHLDVTRQTVSKWECAESTPDFAYLVKLSDIFDVTTDYLLKDTQEKNIPQEAEPTSPAPQTIIVERKFDEKSLLGVCLFFAGVLTIAILSVFAFVRPARVIAGNSLFEGLFGYLIFNNLVWLFLLSCALIIAGLILIILPMIIPIITIIKRKINQE